MNFLYMFGYSTKIQIFTLFTYTQMGTYQHYDFYSIDRPLTDEEQSAVSQLSSRVEPTSRRATLTYHYSDFRHNELEVLNDYFDMFLYTANWGTWQLAIKVPAGLVPYRELLDYRCGNSDYGSHIEIIKKGDNIIIDFYFRIEEYGGSWMESEGILDGLLSLREQILDGDYRLLYISWLHISSYREEYDADDDYDEDYDQDMLEPPVPANLDKLGIALENFVDFWGIDKHLIAAAAQGSESKASTADSLADHLAKLDKKKKDDILRLLLTNEAKAKQELKKQLRQFMEKPKSQQGRRSLEEIMEIRAKVHQIATDKAAKKAKEEHIKKMEDIGKRQAAIWKEVDYNAAMKSSKGYERATEALVELKAYATYADKMVEFQDGLNDVLGKYGKSVAFRRRLQNKGLI